MEGFQLLKSIVEATGLPGDALERELQLIVAGRGLKIEALTLDDVREVLSAYLQDVLVQAKSSVSQV